MSKRIVLTIECPEHMYDWDDYTKFAAAAARGVEQYTEGLPDVRVSAVEIGADLIAVSDD